MTDPQTRIAALVLSGTIERAAQRTQQERSEDVRVALEVDWVSASAQAETQSTSFMTGLTFSHGPLLQPRNASR